MTTLITLTTIFILAATAFAGTNPVPDTGISKCYDNEKEIPCPKTGRAVKF